MTASWFGNNSWSNGTEAVFDQHTYYASGVYDRKAVEDKEKKEEELEQQIQQQANTICTDSEQCASGFACVGGRCEYVDPTGATADGGTAGCGAGVGGDGGGGNGGGDNSGCGGPAASSGGGGSASIVSCSTSSAGSCASGRGTGNGSGGGGGGPCGPRCCTCHPVEGCGCWDKCPPQPPTCSRFCTEAEGLGADVMSCGRKKCDICHYCEDRKELGYDEPTCLRRTYDVDCRCDYVCPGCMQCGVSGNCLIKNCPPEEDPPEDDPGKCEPDANGNLPPECEPCDCNCNDECPNCQLCNTGTGKCYPDPACNESDYRSRWRVSRQGYSTSTIAADCSPASTQYIEPASKEITTSCGPLPHTANQVRGCELTLGSNVDSNG